MTKAQFDLLIVGGGLAGGLTALRFAETHPDSKILLIEEQENLGGHHTWSFHEHDVSPESFSWLKDLITCSWSETEVRFPRLSKKISGGYHSIRSEDFRKILNKKLGNSIRLNTKVIEMTDSKVILEGGKVLNANCVLDARGADTAIDPQLNGYQKFVGYDFVLEEPHGLKCPLIMDANVPQLDGFRFFYLLPWDEKRVLVEETFYSDSPTINEERIARSLRSYVERRGWKIAKIDRKERGVLPIPMTSSAIKNSVEGEPLPIGMRGGFFHSTTGYSLPDAVRIADCIASMNEPTTTEARTRITRFRKPFVSRQRFYRMLNRLLFHASEPGLRYQVLQRFYELPQDLVERFYAGRSTWSDRIRVFERTPSGSTPQSHSQFYGTFAF